MRQTLLALLFALGIWILAGSGFGPTAGANGSLSTPLPPPGLQFDTPVPVHPDLLSQVPGSPKDFHFTHFELYGQFFNPGEQVTITAQHAAVPPITVTADQHGQFAAYVDFTWMFCGPDGVTQLAPVFHAAGNLGSSDTLTLPSQPCPELVTSQSLPSGSQTGGSGGTVIAGTPILTTIVPVATGVPGPPAAPGQQTTPRPPLGQTAVKTTNLVQGFGFQPGEGVNVAEKNSPADTPAPVSTAADSQGEFQMTMTLYVPGRCQPVANAPQVVATGDRGSSASARPAYPPMPMYPCSIPMPTATAVPTPTAVTQPKPTHPSVVLTPKTATAGGTETATIQAPGAGKVRLTVRYAHHGVVRWTVPARSSATFWVQWQVPRTAGAGKATFEALFLPDNIALRRTFTIR